MELGDGSLYLLNQLRREEGGKVSSSRQRKSLFVSLDWTPPRSLALIEDRGEIGRREENGEKGSVVGPVF